MQTGKASDESAGYQPVALIQQKKAPGFEIPSLQQRRCTKEEDRKVHYQGLICKEF